MLRRGRPRGGGIERGLSSFPRDPRAFPRLKYREYCTEPIQPKGGGLELRGFVGKAGVGGRSPLSTLPSCFPPPPPRKTGLSWVWKQRGSAQ